MKKILCVCFLLLFTFVCVGNNTTDPPKEITENVTFNVDIDVETNLEKDIVKLSDIFITNVATKLKVLNVERSLYYNSFNKINTIVINNYNYLYCYNHFGYDTNINNS